MNNLSQNNGPPMPRGQMPIEEVFRMMWARMNYLENALKEKEMETVKEPETQGKEETTTISQLKNENQVISSTSQIQPPDYQENNVNELQELLGSQEERISELAESVIQLKKELLDRSNSVDRSIQEIGADLTEMNTKYTQMNNFLVEIQTTQITVNNQILRHYNENCNDTVESKN